MASREVVQSKNKMRDKDGASNQLGASKNNVAINKHI